MQLKQRLIAGAIACAFTPAIAADVQTFDMGEIVVTATRTPTPVRELLNDISVLTQEDIQQAGQTTLPELLRTLPGVEFISNGGPGTTSNVYLRGTNPNHTLVLIDGLRINSATNGTSALEKLSLGQIERIEVLRGPGSHLYGSEAIGGVIQIFARSGKTPGFHASAGIGSRNLFSASLGGNTRIGATRLNMTVSHESTDGFSALGNAANTRYNPDNDAYRNTSINAGIAHAIDKHHEFGANAFYSDGAAHYDGSTNRTFDSRNKQTLAAYSLYSRNRFLPDWQSLLRLGTSSDNLLTAGNTDWSQIRTDQNQLIWQNDIDTRAGLVTLGTERVEQRVRSSTTNFAVKQRDIQSYFAGYQGRFEAHNLQLNARSDRNSQFGSHVTKSLAYGYRFTPQWRATASVGTAFRAPTFNELYYPVFGNPNLQPESALNKEASLHYDHGAHHVSWVHFENRIHNLIAYASSTYLQTQDARISGDTLDFHGRMGDYNLRASLTHQKAVDAASGLRLTRRAREYATLGADRHLAKWSLGGEVLASGARYDDTANAVRMGGYTVLNLTAGYRYSKELHFLARLNNAFDKQYELARDYNTPDRNIFVGFNYQTP